MPTSLWMSGEIQADVGDEFRLAMNEIQSSVNAVLSSFDYGNGLEEWAVIPMILEEALKVTWRSIST
jgi:hypothetical protein